jgi:MYXO-CTERM domain-containing protein
MKLINVRRTLLSASLMTLMGTAQSASFTVNQALDGADIIPGDGLCDAGGGNCTLRAAIMETNALTGADSITLPAGLYTLSLGNTNEDAAAEGDLDILDDLTITGADSATTTVNGNSYLYRLFSILERADNTLPIVEISNITMSQGLDNDLGALIYNEGNLDLENVILTDANANNFAAVNIGKMGINNSLITNNSLGIYNNEGNLLITNSEFSQNISTKDWVSGSGVFTWYGTTKIINSDFLNNQGWAGGAVYHQGGVLDIEGSNFTGNKGMSGLFQTGGGGAIYSASANDGKLYISNSSFDMNEAIYQGGAIFITRTSHLVAIDNTSFTNNTAGYTGGGIYSEGGYWTKLRRITLDNNMATVWSGGGIFLEKGDVTISESKITNNTAGDEGGGISLGGGVLNTFDSNIQVLHSELSGNSANIGGGIYSSHDGTIYHNLTISNNIATSNGGGYYQEGGSGDLNQVTLANNSSPAATGSNIENNAGTLNINHVIVDNPVGGGINCVGTITSMGNNIASDASCGLGVIGDQANTDPLLDNLADNGGYSNTLALQVGSPAIDAGSSTYCDSVNLVDQRYFYRGDGNCDVGAYEAGSSIAQPGTIAFTSTDFTEDESVGTASITLSRTNGSQGNISIIVYDNGQGTATSGSDYTSVPRAIVEWLDGDSIDKTLEIVLTEDSLEEDDETIQLQFETSAFVSGGANIGTSTTTLLISDNDAVVPVPGTLSIENATYTVSEGAGTLSFDVVRTIGTDGEVSVDIALQNGTAIFGDDFNATSQTGSNVFADGVSLVTNTITIVEDDSVENDETFTIVISNIQGGATLGTATATVTITNNDTSSSSSDDEGSGGAMNPALLLALLLLTPAIRRRKLK